MKIAILTPTFSGFSGADRVVWNEVEELSKEHEVTVYCFSSDLKHAKAKIVILGAPKNRTVERIYKLFYFINMVSILRLVWSLKDYDRIIAFLYPMTWPAMITTLLFQTKYTYYDVGLANPHLFDSFTERTAMRLIGFLTRISIASCDNAISISQFCSSELMRLYGKKSSVKYVKIDETRFNKHINKTKIAAIKSKYKLKKPTLLYVGRISPHKGIHFLLESFRMVKHEYPHANILVVGKQTFGDYLSRLKALSAEGVIFTGFVPDEELPYYYGAADIYVTASLWEGYDMPAVEAQACGKKVVAFDVGSHKEVVKEGILVKEKDVEGFAKAIIKSL